MNISNNFKLFLSVYFFLKNNFKDVMIFMSMHNTGYYGTNTTATQTTVATNTQILPRTKEDMDWDNSTNTYVSFHKLSFYNEEDCNVILNYLGPITAIGTASASSSLFLKANQGLHIDKGDAKVNSFIIMQSGITYNWVGCYRIEKS